MTSKSSIPRDNHYHTVYGLKASSGLSPVACDFDIKDAIGVDAFQAVKII